MDLLAEVLAASRVRGVAASRFEAGEGWATRWPDIGKAGFYAVASGTAWLGLDGHPPRELMPGDVLLLPAGTGHTMSGTPSADGALTAPAADPGSGVLRLGTGAVRTRLLGGCYEYDSAVLGRVLASLPDVVHLRPGHDGSRLDDTVRLLIRELAEPRLASTLVLDRLVDILLVQVLREWLTENPDQVHGTWLGVLCDPLVSEAMLTLHRDPAAPWTTASLAARLAVSRTTLARRFRESAGEAPGSYLVRMRMDLAAVRLRDTDEPLDAVARSAGYTSVYAFSRAFRRNRGQAPGAYRATSRAAVVRAA